MLSPADYGGFAVVVTMMGAFYAIVYMIGQALENQKLLSVAKAEMQEVLIGGFMVMLLAWIMFNVAQQVGFYTIKSFIVPDTTTNIGTTAPTTDNFFFDKAIDLQYRIIGGFTSMFISASTLAGNAATASTAYITRGIEASTDIGGSTGLEISGKPEEKPQGGAPGTH